MYSSIRINGYRGLDSFRMEGLGRVNLLVGANDSGKTSILECIELLRSAGNPHVLWSTVGRAPFRDAHERKAELHTWLAWQDPPGLRLHEAVERTVLDPAGDESELFVNWFKSLFDL